MERKQSTSRITNSDRAFWQMVDSAPDCVNCGGKCHESQDGRQQKCYWCRCTLTRSGGVTRHRGRDVRTWECKSMVDDADAPLIVLEMT